MVMSMTISSSKTFFGTGLKPISRRPLVNQTNFKVQALFTKAKPAPTGKAPTKASSKASSEKVKAQTFEVSLGKNKSFPITLGFTKQNELFVGRMAMLGFAAALVGEILTGQGAIGQLGLETGLSLVDVDGFILALIAFNFIAAVAPASGKFVAEEEDFSDRQAGPLQDPSISLAEPKKFFGIKGFGFTKENELFVGRLAQLGFAASLLGEALTGKGPLGQFGLETGIPLTEAEPLLLFSIAFTLFAAINEGTGKFVREQQE